jgi:NhaA family Na+:H+ antiporter
MPTPPGAPVRNLIRAAVAPIRAFLALEAASGIVLLACALAALGWVNLGGAGSYHAFFELPFTLGVGGAAVTFSLHQLVNDGLMTLFFFVVGMEIKRELAIGELRTLAQAALPGIAALGGMIVPALLFAAFNRGGPGAHGWGIPMATDIAFCVGVLQLLRARVPYALVIFVTALAIFDDIGGILVIALFYGQGIDVPWLLGAAGLAALLFVLSRAHVRRGLAYAAVGALLWYALHHAGIHATIAGVVVGLAIPVRARTSAREGLAALAAYASRLLARAPEPERELDSDALLEMEGALEELEPPLTRFVHLLHPWVAWLVMPLFALANAGVDLRSLGLAQLVGPVSLGAAAGLVLGKLVGIYTFTAVAVRAGLAPMPGGVSHAKLAGVSLAAGIGFTVALFIAALAYPGHPELLDEAKVGILGGSLVAGLAGALLLRFTAPVREVGETAGGDEEPRPEAAVPARPGR